MDSTFPWDMEDVILPPLDGIDGRKAVGFWMALDEAQALEVAASATVDQALGRGAGQSVSTPVNL